MKRNTTDADSQPYKPDAWCFYFVRNAFPKNIQIYSYCELRASLLHNYKLSHLARKFKHKHHSYNKNACLIACWAILFVDFVHLYLDLLKWWQQRLKLKFAAYLQQLRLTKMYVIYIRRTHGIGIF